MFIVELQYKKPLAEIDRYLTAHRDFLNLGYQKNYLIASGPKNPRTGGILLSQLTDRAVLKDFLSQDPFYQQDLADYIFIEFDPVKYHPDFKTFIAAS